MYILLENNIVKERIPDENPVFPGVPIEERYTAEFVANMLHVDDSMFVPEGYVYNPETGEFSEPEPVPYEPLPEPAEAVTWDAMAAAYSEGVQQA